MVTTRRGDYITPEKNPPGPLDCSPALCQPGDEEEEADKAEEGKAISAAVNYAASLTFNDEQLYYENDVAEGGNDDTGGDDRGMNDGDGGNDRDDEGEQQVEEEMGEAWERVTKKRKSQISDDELRTYFDSHLRGVVECPNPSCNCVAIIADRDVCDSVVRYICWFNAKTKYEQDSIVFEWFKYLSYPRMDPRILCFASHLSMTAWQSSLRQFTCMCFALGECSVFVTGKKKMAIDPEGIDCDGRDANAQGERKDELQFNFEQ
jgi:hypothetical protein